MPEKRYMVIEGNVILARDMDLNIALCLVEGYAAKFYLEKLNLTIKEETNDENDSFEH